MSTAERAPAFAVIGAGYGDEGKGVVTDALADRLGAGTVVIRHNGGAQAGHTVTTPDGRRHVFHHVGSGSFAGASTFLSRHFASNPIVLAEEIAALAQLGVAPRIRADERGLLTTPWDMMINQFVEEARGGGRHGSCGLGFGETIERNLNPAFATDLAMLRGDLGRLRDRFDRIRREWVPARLTRLGHPGLYLRHRDLILSEEGLERAVALAVGMLAHVDLVGRPSEAVAPDAPIVFEGAQGLMLDQDRGAFPHVTRSNTGLANVLDVAGELGLGRLQAVYATRAYVTRHGAGPLAYEQAAPPSPLFADATNRPNPWQGQLRFGRLDLDVLGGAIRADLSDAEGRLQVEPRLAMTCLDQFEGRPVSSVSGGRIVQGPAERLAEAAAAMVSDGNLPLSSYGPSRTTLCNLAAEVKA
ncbi:adenylosuccinate synthetase [Methylobacterium brachythecii]|uniref:Adenylosuccinate synthetase n=1 Tax=Methylobacterium brachythecii TaxID=1176177 RepID=A0A7W6ADD9_9HYPH|nr:adenylosuccinate synthetase [Methylobacterium brachythecii]MBB3901193.1 adenylosuccinate synthase [Methylobacterium brachythecii]GLS44624.1 hypothetical protein GCM10007884_26120 [Methylobacterium brachythecii]